MLPFSTIISDKDYWFFRSPVHVRELFVNGLSGTDGVIWLNGVDITSIIFAASSSSMLVQETSGTWMSTYATVNTLSGNWNSVYATTNVLSSNWDSAYSTVCASSAIWSTSHPLSDVTAIGATTTDTVYLSNVNAAALQTTFITTTGISIDTHVGVTKARKIILMDEDGNSFEVYLRGGVLTVD